jgi:hypothetical protein
MSERDASVDDCVLCSNRIQNFGKKFCIGIVTEERRSDGDYEGSFFRTVSEKVNAFIKPQDKDLAVRLK